MRIRKIGPLTQMTFIPRSFPVNCFLFEEDQELTLIDAALPFSVKGILNTAEKIGKPITNIILTHAHSDHLGSLDAIKEAVPNALVSISKRDALLLAGDKTL